MMQIKSAIRHTPWHALLHISTSCRSHVSWLSLRYRSLGNMITGCSRQSLLISFYARPPYRERHYKMMEGVCLSVCPSIRLSVCRMPRPNSRTERPRKPTIGRMEAHHMGNPWTYLEVKSSKIRSSGRLLLSQTMHHTKVGLITIFLNYGTGCSR